MAGALREDMLSRTIPAPLLLVALTACSGAPGENVDQTASDFSRRKVDHISTISYAPNSFVIGNAYPGWTDDIQGSAQFSHGPGNEGGAWYRWGLIYGENFDRCAWIDSGNADADGAGHAPGSKCGTPQELDTPYFDATFTDGIKNALDGDGSETHMHYAGSGCTDRNGYGNVEPWRVPATPANSLGEIPDGLLLRWRYVSRDGDWVMVRQPGASDPNKPNWYFVHRGCVSLANRY
jgi:hypothetical protein